MIPSSITPEEAQERRWDCVVIGAGPAGAFTALRLAQTGKSVLLLDKKSFPREKVCGGCVGADAVDRLDAAGLGEQLRALPQDTADRLQIHVRGRSAQVAVRPIRVIARSDFDACLVQAAVAAGASFLSEAAAFVGDCEPDRRTLEMRHAARGKFALSAAAVIAADGLSHSCLQRIKIFHDRVASRSHVGLGSVVTEDDAWCDEVGLSSGVVQMVVARAGYVGLARSQAGRLHLAAAVRPSALAAHHPPASVVAEILHEAGRRSWGDRARTHWSAADWCGTPSLSHRLNQVSAERLFVLGDAAGYVEPFTGEGISWAIGAAERLSRLLADSPSRPASDLAIEWQADHQRRFPRQARVCRILTSILRTPLLAGWAVRGLAAWPACGASVVKLLNRPLPAGGNLSL